MKYTGKQLFNLALRECKVRQEYPPNLHHFYSYLGRGKYEKVYKQKHIHKFPNKLENN